MAKKVITATWLVTTYNKKDEVKVTFIIENRTEQEAEKEALQTVKDSADWSMVKMKDELKRFCKEWGQNDNELALVLDLDADDDGFSEMAMNLDYVWVAQHRVWVAENNRLYDKRDDVAIEYIKTHR